MLFFFFFSSRRRHTRFDCDWSSDVCSSDLVNGNLPGQFAAMWRHVHDIFTANGVKIGRASCRERVEISVVAVSLKKKKKEEIGGDKREENRRDKHKKGGNEKERH